MDVICAALTGLAILATMHSMNVTYRLKPHELNDSFFQILRSTWTGKEITVTIQEIQGTTEYLLSHEENRRRLLKAVDDAENGRCVRTMAIEEMEAMVQ